MKKLKGCLMMSVLTRTLRNYFEENNIQCEASYGDEISVLRIPNQQLDGIPAPVDFGVIESEDDSNHICVLANRIVNANSQTFAVLSAINEINCSFRWIRMICDEENYISVQFDAIVTQENVGEIAMELLVRIAGICKEVYPKLMKAIWG